MAIIINAGLASTRAMEPAWMLVTDLDGTLLRSDRTFAATDLAALRRLGEYGVLRVVATGRSIFSFESIQTAGLPIDYVIFSTGAGVSEHPDGRIVRSVSLEAGDLRQVNLAPEFVDRCERRLLARVAADAARPVGGDPVEILVAARRDVDRQARAVLGDERTLDVPQVQHPNNIGHLDSPGCFRCHDGKEIWTPMNKPSVWNAIYAIPFQRW